MKMQTLGWVIGLSAVASSFLSCSQPQIPCVAAHAGTVGANQDGAPTGVGFASLYLDPQTSGMGCDTLEYPTSVLFPSNYPDGATLDKVKGDIIGFETYHPAIMTENGPEPDFSKGTVAWQSDGFGQLIKSRKSKMAVDADTAHKAYAFGEWQNIEPDESGICSVTGYKPAEQNFPLVPAVPDDPATMDEDESAPEVPKLDVKYEWKNLKIYVTAAAQGTQFSGDLTYTQGDATNSCTLTTHVLGVWPVVGCDSYGPQMDDMGMPILDDNGDPVIDHIGVPDDSLCCPNADPPARITGSGINPDFPVKCDPTLLICVLDTSAGKELPVLKPGWEKSKSVCGSSGSESQE